MTVKAWHVHRDTLRADLCILQAARHDAGHTEGSFAWSVEQAKLLWAQGQQAVAVRMSKPLLEMARHNKDGNVVGYARLLSLTGKWLAETR